jgi:hypothetical protein
MPCRHKNVLLLFSTALSLAYLKKSLKLAAYWNNGEKEQSTSESEAGAKI